jgi:DDE superfamily endonuclease
MWCVADLTEEYIENMEDVLEIYETPQNPLEPVVCLDEKPVTLHADVRPASPAKPGREARQDNEYERRGTANVFCAVEPKAGQHFTFATPDRSGVEFAKVVFDLALRYPEAETIHLVMDPPPQIADRSARRGSRGRGLGPLHRALHAHSRELAQSGGNRNRHLLAPVPRFPQNPGPEDTAT